MRAVRGAAAAAALLIAAAALAAWLLPRFLDWDQYRQTIAAVASAGLGRPVRIDGPISLSLLPQPILRAGDVSLVDTGDGASATVAEMRLRVALGALLARRIEPDDLVLQGAQIQLPWPLTGLALHRAMPPAGLHAQLEDGTLQVGGLQVRSITGELSVDPATGTLSASGLATVLDRSWRMTGRLGQPGTDGSATVEISLDGQGPAVDTGGSLSGQIAADGSLTGRIAGRGRDLSLLLTAPAQPWRAVGRVVAGSGLLVADDLDLDIGGAPARGAVALRLLPQPRLDAALATSRLDLDAWLPPLLQGTKTALPTGIDLSAEAASLGGGTLRHLRAGFELAPEGVTVREAAAVLPGDADLHVSGQLRGGRFSGDARLAALNLPQTLAWLRPRSPSLAAALPPAALRTATIEATVLASADSLALGNLHGDADGTVITGELGLHGGDHPTVAANLQLSGLVLDAWLPEPPARLSGYDLAAVSHAISALPQRLAGVDGDITLVADSPVWRGTRFDQLTLAARFKGGTLDLRQASLTGPDVSVTLSGQVAGNRIGDARLDVRFAHAAGLRGALPDAWRPAETLFRGPMALQMTASGDPGAMRLTAKLDLADAELQAAGAFDLAASRWKGTVSLRHPGAPRLLSEAGFADAVAWLGDGSLSGQAAVDAGPDRVALSGLVLSAGALRTAAELAVTGLDAGRPALSGSLDADTLPLPLPYARSPEPWPLTPLQGWQAHLAVRASHVLIGLSPALETAAATLTLAGGTLRLDDGAATLAGGKLTGRASLEASSPPRVALTAKLVGAVLAGPLLESVVDVAAGRLDATADVSASGYSPAGVLATVGGSVQARIRDGVLTGLDAAGATASLPAQPTGAAPSAAEVQAAVAHALQSGTTRFNQLDLSLTAAKGVVTASQGGIDTGPVQIGIAGSVNLPEAAVDARLLLQPVASGSPAIGLRLIGPWSNPTRTVELAGVAAWLAAR